MQVRFPLGVLNCNTKHKTWGSLIFMLERITGDFLMIYRFFRRKLLIGLLSGTVGFVLLLYLGFVIFFSNHFLFHTHINGIDVSCKTVSDAEKLLSEEVATYKLTINGRKDITDTIYARDINLTYTRNDDISNYMKAQSAFSWISSAFKKTINDTSSCVSYDVSSLKSKCKSLAFFQKENISKPKNATIAYLENSGFQIVSEDYGSKPITSNVLSTITSCVDNLQEDVDLEANECYLAPEIISDAPILTNLYEKLSKYSSASLTYTFGDNVEVLDVSVFHDWLKISPKKGTITVKKSKVEEYVKKLAANYNTYGKKRTFKASTGNKVSVSGGTYGWLIDQEKETKQIIKCIKKGVIKDKTPAFTKKASSFGAYDWGKTYVEINLTAQHLWFYKKGKLVIDSDFVSGNVRRGNATPSGVYYVIFRERDAILGERSKQSYRTPVSYWMPFNAGIGMHDATWRSKFGGNIYQTAGSHGCINLPFSSARTIFENIESGTPVICYFDSNYNPSQLEEKDTLKKKNEKSKNETKNKTDD